MYQPLLDRSNLSVIAHEPVVCCNEGCRAVLNPYCMLDLAANIWICPLCFQHNQLPKTYQITSPETLPLELQPQNATVEYAFGRVANYPPVFMFVVDVCQDAENFAALKDTLLVSLSLLPPNALIGLVSYGTNVQVHELGYSHCFKTIAFNGKKEYTSKQIQETLGFLSADLRVRSGRPLTAVETAARYLLPVQDAEYFLTKTLEELQADSFSVKDQNRPLRATGVALNVGISLLETAFPSTGSRIMLFAAGPCTSGPGLIVDRPYKDAIRSHHDIDEDNIPHYKAASKYYEHLAKRSSKNGIIVDIFAGSYDQVGLDEMKSLPHHTGGFIVLADAFTTSIFKQSFLRIFNKDEEDTLTMGMGGNLEVKMSRDIRVSGLIGNAIGQNNKNGYVAETSVGIGGTNSWKLGGILPRSTYALYFDVVNTKQPTATMNETQPQAFIQFLTYYQHASGYFRLRVTTVSRSLSTPGLNAQLQQSFDQEAAAALIARMAVYRSEYLKETNEEILRWLDTTLIKLCSHFGDYVKGDPSSFKLIPEMGYYFPQFLYHLRRGPFIQVFNNSPDETAYYRHVLFTEDTNNTTIMIQPTLNAYEIGNPTESMPVLLDSTSLTPDRILLMDTYFHILIYHGETIAAWRKAGYQEQEEYANFALMLQQPRADASELLVDRIPLPRFIDTEAKGSQARFLMARLNPTNSSSNTNGYSLDGSAIVLTDDVSLQVFMDCLIKIAVSSKQKA